MYGGTTYSSEGYKYWSVGVTDLHVVENEEECLYGQSLEEFEGVQVRGRMLVVVKGGGARRSLDIRSNKQQNTQVKIHTYIHIYIQIYT